MKYNPEGVWRNKESNAEIKLKSIGGSVEDFWLDYTANGIVACESYPIGLRRGVGEDSGRYGIPTASNFGFNFLEFLSEDRIMISNTPPFKGAFKEMQIIFERVK